MRTNNLRKLYKSLTFAFLLLCFWQQLVASASNGKVKVYTNGNVVAAWISIDASGNATVVGGIGTVSTAPADWTLTTLSSGISDMGNSVPVLISTTAGDVVVLWQYPDSNGNFHVAASMLPNGTTAWNTAIISDTSLNAGLFDQTASIDDDGNILAIWTEYDPSTGTATLRGNTAVMGATSTWNGPMTIAQ